MALKEGFMNVKLLRDCCLIKVTLTDEEVQGIAIPDDIKRRKQMEASHGFVVAIGPEVKTVTIGDEVMYKSFIGNIIEHDSIPSDGMYLVVAEKDILAAFPVSTKIVN